MFQITKSEPNCFKRAKSRVALPNISDAWSDSNISNIRADLRADILDREQNLLCAYCEKKIDSHPDNSNIDHFRTRNLFPNKTLDYDNLLVSCNTKDRCSTLKDKSVKKIDKYEKIINPVVENPDNYFDYLLTGEMLAIGDNEKANYTIDVFNLGRDENSSLSQTRKQIATSLEYCSNNLSLEEVYAEFGNEHHSFINIIYKKLKAGSTL